MKKTLLAAAGVFAITAVTFSGGAKAQCAWNGFAWTCAPPAAAGPAYPYDPYMNPYGSTYPTVGTVDGPSGYKPNWMPSYPGPRPSSGAGH